MSEYPREEFDKSWWIAEHMPSRLTEFDLRVLKSFSPDHAERARLLRDARPELPSLSGPEPAPIQAQTPQAIQTKSAPVDRAVTHKTLEKWFASYTTAVVTILKDVLRERDEKLAELRTSATELTAQYAKLQERYNSLEDYVLQERATSASGTVPRE